MSFVLFEADRFRLHESTNATEQVRASVAAIERFKVYPIGNESILGVGTPYLPSIVSDGITIIDRSNGASWTGEAERLAGHRACIE